MECKYDTPIFLYIMVYIAMMGSCAGNATSGKQTQVLDKLNAIEQKIEKMEKGTFANKGAKI